MLHGKVRHMLKRFIRAMEYRSYCMAIRELRHHGYYKKADEITEFKNNMYPSY